MWLHWDEFEKLSDETRKTIRAQCGSLIVTPTALIELTIVDRIFNSLPLREIRYVAIEGPSSRGRVAGETTLGIMLLFVSIVGLVLYFMRSGVMDEIVRHISHFIVLCGLLASLLIGCLLLTDASSARNHVYLRVRTKRGAVRRFRVPLAEHESGRLEQFISAIRIE